MGQTETEALNGRRKCPTRRTSPSLPQPPKRFFQHNFNDGDHFLSFSARQESTGSTMPSKRPTQVHTPGPSQAQQERHRPRSRQNLYRQQGQEFQEKILIYRNAKYNGILGRFRDYVKNYAQLMLLQPLEPIMSEFHKLFLEVLGFIYFILMTLPHAFIALCLVLLRQCRLFLVKKYYPAAIVCEDLSPRCVFVGKCSGLVTCVVWMKGKVDAQKLRSYFKTKFRGKKETRSSILEWKLSDRFGLRVLCALDSENKFDIKNHIQEAPREFLRFFIREEIISQYGKSALQQFVTNCASEKLNSQLPPWKITVIPQPVYEKEKTCCVLQFHYILLQNRSVNELLDQLFHQSLYPDQPLFLNSHPSAPPPRRSNAQAALKAKFTSDSHPFLPHRRNKYSDLDLELRPNNSEDHNCDETSTSLASFRREVSQDSHEIILDFEMPRKAILRYILKLADNLHVWIQRNVYISMGDLRTWVSLQKKQFEFHRKVDLVKSVACEVVVGVREFVRALEAYPGSSEWAELKGILAQLWLILRAISFVPVEIFACLLHTYPRGGNGFRKCDPNDSRRISWSPPISKSLLNAICRETGASPDSVILAGISLALKEYYSETNIPNPKRLGVIVPIVTKDLLAPTGYTTLDLRTESISLCDQVQALDGRLKEFQAWKLLGNYLIVKYLTHLLPRPLAYLVFRKIFSRYPISFTKLNLQSPTSILLPHISLWGQSVEEFMYWRPPQADYCVSISLVNYSENLRLSVLSPIKSLDVALARKYCQQLNRIAEAVGVERNLIPYSTKSSPVSSHCSSPSVLKAHEAILSRR